MRSSRRPEASNASRLLGAAEVLEGRRGLVAVADVVAAEEDVDEIGLRAGGADRLRLVDEVANELAAGARERGDDELGVLRLEVGAHRADARVGALDEIPDDHVWCIE